MFSSFDFTPDDPVELSAVLKPVVENFVENSELIQEMQANSIIISYYDSLCYSIEPKVNKELNLNLLESMLELFVKVWMFSFARDIKEKHKVRNKKTKAWSLRTEIKKSSYSKDFNHLISSSIQCSLRSRTLNIDQKI